MSDQLHDENQRRQRLAQLERFLRKELRRYDLRHREQTIAELILQLSMGFGKTSVVIPRLDLIVDMTGISKGNVHTNLKNLHSMDIVRVYTKGSNPTYSINPNPNLWKCRERVPRTIVRKAMDYVKMANNIAERIDSDVASAINELFIESQKETHENFNVDPPEYFLPGIVPDEGTIPDGRSPFPPIY